MIPEKRHYKCTLSIQRWVLSGSWERHCEEENKEEDAEKEKTSTPQYGGVTDEVVELVQRELQDN